MKTLLPIFALMALVGCASQPTITTMVEQPDIPEEEDTSGVVEPWSNPIKVSPGEPAPRRTVQQILNDADAKSRRSVQDGGWKGAKLRYRWVDGESYDIVVAKDRTTTLKLFPGEGFNNYSYGEEGFGPPLEATWSGTRDAKAMPYGPAQTAIPIVPWVSKGCTDLTIYTTWRDILINVCATGKSKPHNRIVEWWMPGEELRRFADALASGEVSAPTMEPATGVPHAEIKARYKVTGEKPEGWSANDWVAFHDGKRTYIVPPAGLPFTAVPALMSAEGGETPIFRHRQRLDQQGGYYQIEALPPEIIMTYGSQTLTFQRYSE